MVQAPRISFCTSYLGREEHLKKTKPVNEEVAARYDSEFIYLDYGEYSNKWHMAKAKNMAHDKARGDILINIDVDNILTNWYVNNVLKLFDRSMDIVVAGKGENVGGRIAISRNNFNKLGGYNEDFTGWGYEDLDFIDRAINLGCKLFHISGLESIQHSDDLRWGWNPKFKNRDMWLFDRDNGIIDWRKKA